jgi:hypothetical protein
MTETITVGGLGGGAGTSTVALALGGLLAWSGRRVLVAGGDDLLRLCGQAPWTGPGARELAALGGADSAVELQRLTRPVPGVDGLSVLGGGAAELGDTTGWPVDAIVADLRTAAVAAATVLVARPDASVALGAGLAHPVLVNGTGPLDGPTARRLLGRPPAGRLAADARVARAGLSGRVPADLPGRWLADLRAAFAS